MITVSCGSKQKKEESSGVGAILGARMPDTLRVGTLYSPTSYFIYKDEPMGFDYEMARQMAEAHGMNFTLTVATSVAELCSLLQAGKVDLLAYDIPVTDTFRKGLRYCGPVNVTSQVLVQPKNGKILTDVTQLVGQEIYVEKGSKYEQRMKNLNRELGGGIVIIPLDNDSLIEDDIIDMVSKGSIPMSVVDSEIAALNEAYYPEVNASLKVGFDQKSAWAVRSGDYALAEAVDRWCENIKEIDNYKVLHKKYFELSRARPEPLMDVPNVVHGRLSPYDAIFRREAESIGEDWRLLAAIGFVESRFEPTQVSWAGARGVMQIMPSTARAMGSSPELMDDPSQCIIVGAKLIAYLSRLFEDKVADPSERMKFIIASYNSGPGHILDAIALAKKYGRNPQRWEGNVAEMARLKQRPEYYSDPVVKSGYFNARETLDFVERVENTYNTYRAGCPR